MGKKSSSPPAAPDPYQVAGAQGAINADTARLMAQLNRPTVNTPFGSQTWTNLGGDQYASNIKLAPEQQQLFDQQNRISFGLGGAAEGALGNVTNTMSQPFSLNDAMDTLSSVTEPQFQRDQDALNTRLINSGFRQGSEGFDQAQQDFQVNKDRSRAATAQQALALSTALRNQPLSELNALRTGAMPQMPQGQQSPNIGVQPADITGAFGNQYQGQLAGYNANVANNNAKLGAGAGLGAAALMAPAGTFAPLMAASDRRLKSNIRRIGTHPLGIWVYEYDIGAGHEIGVMADEVEKVLPSAVKEIHGFKVVDYAQLAG